MYSLECLAFSPIGCLCAVFSVSRLFINWSLLCVCLPFCFMICEPSDLYVVLDAVLPMCYLVGRRSHWLFVCRLSNVLPVYRQSCVVCVVSVPKIVCELSISMVCVATVHVLSVCWSICKYFFSNHTLRCPSCMLSVCRRFKVFSVCRLIYIV